MSNIEFVRSRLTMELDRAISRRDHYRNGADGLKFSANFALEQHYEGKSEAYQMALSLLDLLDDENKK